MRDRDDHPAKKPGPDPELAYVRKERRCLMCRTAFVSDWSGERICRKCKTLATWREGEVLPTGSGQG